VINGLPDPDAAWHALLTFLLERPEIAGEIVTVTHRVMYLAGHGYVIDDLPDSARARFGLSSNGPGTWWLAEFTSPIRPATALPDTPPDTLDPRAGRGY
jgi:hypothetical protein